MSSATIALPGCTPEPLMSCLKALGVFWLVAEQAAHRTHTANVCRELAVLLETLDLDDGWRADLTKAARWYDLGKAHWAFHQGMRNANPSLAADQLWAKSGVKTRLRHGRRHFQHELASALTALQQDLPFAVAYLIAAHHGRARLSIRALPGEDEPATPDTLFALGIHHGDSLNAVDLAGETCPAIALDLTPMQLGGEQSWTASALRLLAELAPFRLAIWNRSCEPPTCERARSRWNG